MKKILSLLIAVCMVCLCTVSLAEMMTAGAEPVQLDGLSLALDQGVSYKLASKVRNQVYFTVYPYSRKGDTATNFNCAWNGTVFSVTPSELKIEMEAIKQEAITGMEAQGIRINSSYDIDSNSYKFSAVAKFDSKVGIGEAIVKLAKATS